MATGNFLVDTTIGVVVFGSLYEGYRKGLVTNLLGLAGFTTVLLLCLAFGETLSQPLKSYVPLPTTYATLAAYIAISFVIALSALFLHRVFNNLLAKKIPPALDAIGGMFAGALRGTVFMVLCLVILLLMANPVINEQISNRSRIGSAFLKEVSKVSPTVKDIFTSPPSPMERKKVRKKKGDYEEVVDSFSGSQRGK